MNLSVAALLPRRETSAVIGDFDARRIRDSVDFPIRRRR